MAVPISNVTRRVVFAPSGTGPYAFTFEILAATDIEVYKGDTLLTLTTDYSVTINANGTGSVTLVLTAGTDNITIVGARAIERLSDFVTGGDFFANTVNSELDSLTIFAQQNAEAVTRSIQAPVTDPTTIDMTLPTKTDRAGKYLSFNTSTGDPEVVNTVVDVTAVAANATNINTVAGISSNVTTVAGVAANVTTVAGVAANVTTVAGVSADVTTVAGISADVTAVAGDATDIGTVAGIAADVTAVAAIDSDVTAVAADATDIGTVATDLAGSNTIGTVAGIAANVSTVAGISADVTTVAADGADIGAVAAIDSDVTTVAGIAANVTTVAGISANVTTVAGISADVTTVATNVTDITNFSDVYLGPAASDPATRNDSSALQAGDLYFNTVDGAIKVYTGSTWVTAYITAAGFVNLADAQTITGVKTFDNGLDTDTISEKTSAAGVTVDGVLLKDSEVTTDVIKEKTSAAGVTIDGVLLKDTTVTANTVTANTIVVSEVIYPVASFSWNSALASPAAAFDADEGRLINAHRNMKRCLLLDNGTVNYFLDPTNSALKADGTASVLTGADGMVMVQIPKFYVRRQVAGTITTWSVSDTALPGFVVHPAFDKDGVEVDYRYYSAYDACAFDDSGSTFISGLNRDNAVSNTPNVDVTASTGDVLASVSGVYPMVGLTRAQFRTLAANRGSGWRQLDWTLFSAVQVLYLTEYQTFFSQSRLGDGNVNGSYVTQSGDQNDSPNSIAGLTNSIGNASTNGSQASAGAKPGTAFMSYRGIENFYGNVFNWADGCIVNPDGSVSANEARMWWTNNSADFSDSVKTNMTEIAVDLTTGNDFASAIAATDYFFVATSVSGGSASTFITDRYTGSTSDDRVVLVGGNAGYGASAGAFFVLASDVSSIAGRSFGARLAF